MKDSFLKETLVNTKSIAIVGLSKNWNRPSNFVAKYLIDHGYDVVPVNPRYDEIFGLDCFDSVADIPRPIDMVNCFRKPDDLNDVLQDTIDAGVGRLWLQIGVVNHQVRKAASSKNISVVMDKCIKIEHARLFGGLNFVGVNTKVISAKRSRQVYN